VVSFGGITLHRNGKPLTAGEIPEGAEIIFDRTTGEVLSVLSVQQADDKMKANAKKTRKR
jgi:hypothetical protein